MKTHHSKENHVRRLMVRFARLRTEAGDAGMNTAEYAVGTLAAVAFAGRAVQGRHQQQGAGGADAASSTKALK